MRKKSGNCGSICEATPSLKKSGKVKIFLDNELGFLYYVFRVITRDEVKDHLMLCECQKVVKKRTVKSFSCLHKVVGTLAYRQDSKRILDLSVEGVMLVFKSNNTDMTPFLFSHCF